MGVQFPRLSGLNASYVGDLHKVFSAEYPEYQERPPLEPIPENFGPSGRPAITFQLADFPALPRLWFVSDGGDNVIQIQQDRFICNWRRTDDSAVYPRFQSCYSTFCQNLEKFEAFLSSNSLGSLKPSLGELVYVNHFPTTTADGQSLAFSDICTLLAVNPGGTKPEEVHLSAFYPIVDDGRRVGGIETSFAKQVHKGRGEPVFELRLNCRGTPLGPGLSGLRTFLELAHVEENKVFLSLTSQRLQKEWGKR